MAQKNITKNVVFEPSDYKVVKNLAKNRGLGQRGISAALRMIIREWAQLQASNSHQLPPHSPTAQ